MPGDELCDYCARFVELGFENSGRYEDYGCECETEDTPYAEWVQDEVNRIGYTKAFESLLSNRNPTWCTDILDKKLTIKHSLGKETTNVTFRIVCQESFCQDVKDIQDAWDVLETWGIFDLPSKAEMDIVLTFEEVEKTVIRGYEVKNSVVREFRIPGAHRLATAT